MASVTSRSTRELRSSARAVAEVQRRAEMHGDRCAVPPLAVRRLHVARADQPDRDDRRAAAQGQPGHPGAELVQPAVRGAGALREDPQRPVRACSTSTPMSITPAAARVSARSTGTCPQARKKAAIARPRRPGVVKYSALAK